MSKLNPSTKTSGGSPVMSNKRLAGGTGALAAKQDNISLLRRCVLANLLFENIAYMDGASVSAEISKLIPLCKPQEVAELAIEARVVQKLRHMPLYLVCEMLKHEGHKQLVAEILPKIITRPDMLSDMLSLYFKQNPTPKGKKHAPIASALKKGLAASFDNFNEYAFAKYDKDGAIKLRDVMFLVRPKPVQGKEDLYEKIADRTLATPDTWEVQLSSGANKKATWERLIAEKKLGALAFLRNLRNMKEAGVEGRIIHSGFDTISSQMLLPLNFIQAAKNAPDFASSINRMMLKTYENLPKIPGYSIFVVDLSGSMGVAYNPKSTLTRIDAAIAMAMLAFELCESVDIYVTAGNDSTRKHSTRMVQYPKRGFELGQQIADMAHSLGGGGIFTRQCLEYIRTQVKETPDRIMIFSDSQDCDFPDKRIPAPFGKNNYIVDVSSNTHGINYKGLWTAEISGFSENFLTYIAAYEGLSNEFEED